MAATTGSSSSRPIAPRSSRGCPAPLPRYPKGSSKRQSDLTRDKGWDSLRDQDLMWLSLISIDDAWSAFSLRKYKPGEARQTFR
jgi:hypothetical protein